MAHYVQIPKDLNDIKEKFIMGLRILKEIT